MRHLTIFIASIIIFSSCTDIDLRPANQAPKFHVEPELMPYWDQFQYEAERLGYQIPRKNIILAVKPADHRDMAIYGITLNGICYHPTKGNTSSIFIRKELMEQYSDYSLAIEATVFHELGHAFGRKHNNYYYDSLYTYVHKGDSIEQSKTWNVSLMTLPSYRPRYEELREYYLKELFGLIEWEETDEITIKQHEKYEALEKFLP